MTPHADAAAAALKSAIERDYAPVRASAERFGQTIKCLRASTDLDDVLPSVGNLILAAEGLALAATETAKSARAAMKAAMSNTNCPAVELPSHCVSLAAKSPSAVVTDKALLPPRFWVEPEPRPDLVAVGKALRGGEQVPGAELSNDREPVLVFRSKVS